ncbi:MAG: hypothetical protein GKC07_02810 [Methanomicrobiales archaeon]|nr:hypothetical protein [Methanomicrobiales archaeon]
MICARCCHSLIPAGTTETFHSAFVVYTVLALTREEGKIQIGRYRSFLESLEKEIAVPRLQGV